MSVFNRFKNKLKEGTSKENTRVDEEGNSTAEGFLCPQCLNAFPSPEKLQGHYESEHGHNESQDFLYNNSISSNSAVTCPLCLEDFVSVDIFNQHYSKKHLDLEALPDITMYKEQLKAMEEGKALLSSEVMLLRKQLTDALGISTRLEEEKVKVEKKAGVMAGDLTNIKSKYDEERGKRVALEEYVNELQITIEKSSREIGMMKQELDVKPNGDDAAVLKNELVSIQTLMDQLSKEKEEEKERLKSEYKMLADKFMTAEETLSTLRDAVSKAPKLEDYTNLTASLTETSLSTKQLEDIVAAKDACIQELEDRVKEIEEERRTISTQKQVVDEEVEMFGKEVEKLKLQVEDAEKFGKEVEKLKLQVEDTSQQLSKKNEEVEEVKLELESVVADKLRLSHELEETKSVSNQHLTQLQQNVSSLTSQLEGEENVRKAQATTITDLEQQVEKQQQEYLSQCADKDDLKAKLNECNSELASERRFGITKDEKILQLEGKICAVEQEVTRLDNERQELSLKIEAGEGTATLIDQLKHEKDIVQEKLDETVRQHRENVEGRAKQLDELHQELDKANLQLKNHVDRQERLKTELKSKEEECVGLQQKVEQRDGEIEKKMMELAASEAQGVSERSELKAQVEEMKGRGDRLEIELDEKRRKCEKMEGEMKSQGDILHSVKEDVVMYKGKCELLESEVRQMTDSLRVRSEQMEEMEDKVKEVGDKLKEMEDKVKGKECEVREMEEKVKAKDEGMRKIEEMLYNVKAEVEKERGEKMKLESDVKMKTEQCDELMLVKERVALEREEIERVTSTKIEALERDTEKLELELKCRSDEVVALGVCVRDKERELEEARVDHGQQIQSLRTECENVKVERDNTTKNLEGCKEKSKELEESLQKMSSNVEEMTQGLEQQTQFIAEQERELGEIRREKDDIVSELEKTRRDKEVDIQTLRDEVGQVQGEKERLESQLEQQRAEAQAVQARLEEEVKDLSDGRNLLLQQKVELQAKAEEIEKRVEMVQSDLRNKQMEYSVKVESLGCKLEEEGAARRKVEKEKEEKVLLHEIEVASLSDVVSSLKSNLLTVQGKVESLQQHNDELTSSRLELEAKLDNGQDERRVVMERCLSSESECDRLKEREVELMRKLEEAQSAMHELGRENQSLQVENSKVMSRQWATDEDVNNCMKCMKSFTVTVRKHHCRHCGNIFCNDCSAKTISIVASKKPVRVCDDCYMEISSIR